MATASLHNATSQEFEQYIEEQHAEIARMKAWLAQAQARLAERDKGESSSVVKHIHCRLTTETEKGLADATCGQGWGGEARAHNTAAGKGYKRPQGEGGPGRGLWAPSLSPYMCTLLALIA